MKLPRKSLYCAPLIKVQNTATRTNPYIVQTYTSLFKTGETDEMTMERLRQGTKNEEHGFIIRVVQNNKTIEPSFSSSNNWIYHIQIDEPVITTLYNDSDRNITFKPMRIMFDAANDESWDRRDGNTETVTKGPGEVYNFREFTREDDTEYQTGINIYNIHDELIQTLHMTVVGVP